MKICHSSGPLNSHRGTVVRLRWDEMHRWSTANGRKHMSFAFRGAQAWAPKRPDALLPEHPKLQLLLEFPQVPMWTQFTGTNGIELIATFSPQSFCFSLCYVCASTRLCTKHGSECKILPLTLCVTKKSGPTGQ